uniref:C-type lectin domain-containing protein n=1 Tax=Panagrolaimus superbus TaxID=310955 RepID=A0A914Y6D8_9BILA
MDPFSIIDHDYEGGCRQFNGHLPSIHNMGTNAYIVDLVANAPPNLKNPKRFGIIIGLQKNVNGAWEWTDGTPKDFLHWYNGPNGGGCSAIIVDENDPNNHGWDSIGCTQDVYAYVCYNLPKKDQPINF